MRFELLDLLVEFLLRGGGEGVELSPLDGHLGLQQLELLFGGRRLSFVQMRRLFFLDQDFLALSFQRRHLEGEKESTKENEDEN